MYIYAWNNQGNLLGNFPGKQVTVGDDGWYVQSFDQSPVNFLFSSNGSPQTANMENVTESSCYGIVDASGFRIVAIACPKPQPVYGGGQGTASDPYIISNGEHLQTLSETNTDWNKFFSVTIPVNMSNNSFTSIGTKALPFTGTFQGGQKEISHLSAKKGLFGYTDGASISEVALMNVHISGEDREVGGLIGYAKNTAVQRSYVHGTVDSDGGVTGGLVGVAEASQINACFSRVIVNVSGGICAGGFIGIATAGSVIKNSYSSGDVNANLVTATGGFAGKNEASSIIENSYATGNVISSKSYSGGFVGANYATIKASAEATGSISSTVDYVARFGGNNNSRNSSLDNITWSGTTIAAGESYGDEGVVSGQKVFLLQSSFSDKGWDFSANWTFDEEKYPKVTGLDNQVYPYPFDIALSNAEIKALSLQNTSLFPNPFEEKISISGIKNIQSVAIYNEVGTWIKCTVNILDTGAELYNVSNLYPGNYMIKVVTTDGNTKVFKAIKK
jgi:hypothetical protein